MLDAVAPSAPMAGIQDDLPATSLRQRLRDATADPHARLDSIFGTLDLTGVPGYRRFLTANAAALLPLETSLSEAGVSRIFPDWKTRSRRRAILSDLDALGSEPSLLPVPRPTGFAGVFGAMYVLEGSRLGARMVLRTVMRSADPRVTGATAYLRHGEGLHLWESFLKTLESNAARLGCDSGLIDGALRAFDMFEQAAMLVCPLPAGEPARA